MASFDAARLVKDVRARSGLSQRALAERAGTSQSVVARIELRQTSPTTDTLNRLLAAADAELTLRLHPDPPESRDDRAGLIRRIQAFFDRRPVPGLVSVYLFGSAAIGTRHAESDVDIAVLLDRRVHPAKGERSTLRVDLGSDLVAALGLNEIDLVVLNDVPPGLGRSIVVEGIRLVCHDPGLDHAFMRDVQLRWCDLAPFLRRTAAVKLEALGR